MGLHFGRNNAQDRDLIATNRGELHYTSVRHADDMPPAGFVYCKTPIEYELHQSAWTTAA